MQTTAERAGIAQSQLHRIEHGTQTPGAGVLLALADVLGVTVHWLVTGTHVAGDQPEHPAAQRAFETFLESPVAVDTSQAERDLLRVFAGQVPSGLRPNADYLAAVLFAMRGTLKPEPDAVAKTAEFTRKLREKSWDPPE